MAGMIGDCVVEVERWKGMEDRIYVRRRDCSIVMGLESNQGMVVELIVGFISCCFCSVLHAPDYQITPKFL